MGTEIPATTNPSALPLTNYANVRIYSTTLISVCIILILSIK